MSAWANRSLGALLLVTAAGIFAQAQQAQQPTPHAAYIYPAGGQKGATFTVNVGGQFLAGARSAYFSGSGVSAQVVEVQLPLNPMQLNAIREELQKLVQSHGGPPGAPNAQRPPRPNAQQPAQLKSEPGAITPWTPADLQRAAELRDKIAQTMRRQQSPALSQTAVLRVSIAPDAARGVRELRLLTNAGLTNPVVFCVDQLPEVSRPFQSVPLALSVGGGLTVREQGVRAPKVEPPTRIELPAIVNGQMMPAAADRYVFHARKGQHLVIAAMTRALIPYISDAVPGWFQAKLTLADADGHELASADHFRFSQDPVVEQDIAADGDYTLELHDAIFRGREDFVYRVAIGELPYVTGLFPLGTKEGAKTNVEISGWNLKRARFVAKEKNPAIHLLPDDNSDAVNAVEFAVDTLPERTEKGPATSTKNAKRVKLPIIINSRIARPGDAAVFRLDGGAGEEIVAEVIARRLGSPLDSVLVLTDATGKQLAFNDDFEDKGAALVTHQADSRLQFRLPRKGSYFLRISDAQQNGGPEFAYRLRISHPMPDFELRVVPSSINLRPGMSVPATVHVLRHDGFSGAISLRLKDAPDGLVLKGGEIPAGVNSVRVTLTAPSQALSNPQKLSLEGEASISGRVVRHLATPADDMEQAFAWHHLVAAQQGYVMVIGGARRNAIWGVSDHRVTLAAGGAAEVKVAVPPAQLMSQVQFALDDPPDGITIGAISREGNAFALQLRANATAKPGQGNLIINASVTRPVDAANQRPAANRAVPLGTLPAIPYEIVQH